ncbi:vacuolar protein sorting-associated protein 45 [Tulasnella sp. 424]|nr:vacuolar protein sorting-associated protein 45 [Tulasnella sp. 424]
MTTTVPGRQPRTLILCFDGTADSFDDDTTNVVRLFAAFEKQRPDRQLCYYQPGIGTYLGSATTWSRKLQTLAKTADQAVAWYLDTHIMGGYRFLMQHYVQGDRICMFGFSRGAYTARCLAGMLNKIGLLPVSNEEHMSFAYKQYTDISPGNENRAKLFKETFSVPVEIAFMGVWDTVASCGIIGRHLPFTASNHIIRIFRHALALDERRGKFKPNQWHRTTHSAKGAENDPNRATTVVPLTSGTRTKETLDDYIQSARDGHRSRTRMESVWSDDQEAYDSATKREESDVKEVWFPGCHADVGGGSVKNGTKHCLANASLVWMVNNIIQADVGIVFTRNAFQSPENAGLVPHFGVRPGVDSSWLKGLDPAVKLDTVEGYGEKSCAEDVVRTTGLAYSPDKPIVTITAPPPNAQQSNQVTSSTPSVPDRRRQSSRLLQRQARMDVVVPPREPPSRSSEITMFSNDDDSEALCWLSQEDMEKDANAEMVDQLDEEKVWWILEYLPLWQHYQDREGHWHKGFHFNRGKPRCILNPDVQFHISAKLRTRYSPGAQVKGGVMRPATMDVLLAVSTYISKMVSSPSAIKVLLLDSHTTPFVSLATTQSELLAQQVYLTDRIDNSKRDRMPHLKCVCFLGTSEESLAAITSELEEPKYGEYYLYFSNVLTKRAIERLAEADSYEVVHEVQEFFADYAPILPSLFSLNHVPSATLPLYGSSSSTWNQDALTRSAQGLMAILLSLKKKPIIRYEKMSAMARKLGSEVQHLMKANEALFDFRPTQVPPLLLIIDRLNDPVTPLLSQWTYQAMVHELLGIINGRVDLSLEITLLPQSDPFFSTHLNDNFGDLGASVQNLVKDYQSKTQSQASIETIADMKRFVEEYPEFRKLSGNVSKHVALVGELSRLVGRDKLLDVSEVEQSLAGSGGGHANDLKAVQTLIAANDVPPLNKLRLAILYALRYQKNSSNATSAVTNSLLQHGVSEQEAKLVNIVLNVAGADQRQDDLFSTENIFSRGKSALKGLKGVENVYTQHSPHLMDTLELLLKGRLREASYPFLDATTASTGLGGAGAGSQAPGQRPQDVIIFMVGGTTYEEARAIARLNQELAGQAGGSATRVLLGGTCIHNSSSFLHQLSSAPFPPSYAMPPPETASNTSTSAERPALAVQLGNINVSVGGAAGTGVYRTASTGEGISLQADGLKEGVERGVKDLWGKMRQGVERLG